MNGCDVSCFEISKKAAVDCHAGQIHTNHETMSGLRGKILKLKLSDRTFDCGCGKPENRDVHAAKNMVRIAEMVLGNLDEVPVERREITRVEFCEAFGKRFPAGFRLSCET